MKKMKVAIMGLYFNPENNISSFKIKLPKDTKILSAHLDEKNNNSFWLNFIAPSIYYEMKDGMPVYEYEFYVVKANYTDVMVDNHEYLATFWIEKTAYTVFYKNLR